MDFSFDNMYAHKSVFISLYTKLYSLFLLLIYVYIKSQEPADPNRSALVQSRVTTEVGFCALNSRGRGREALSETSSSLLGQLFYQAVTTILYSIHNSIH
jgi:hypothetical protein